MFYMLALFHECIIYVSCDNLSGGILEYSDIGLSPEADGSEGALK
jgi:hypothetical protein